MFHIVSNLDILILVRTGLVRFTRFVDPKLAGRLRFQS